MTFVRWWQRLTLITRFLGLVARVDVNYPVSKRFDFGKEETGFLCRGWWGGKG
jgi:hypothetical protein